MTKGNLDGKIIIFEDFKNRAEKRKTLKGQVDKMNYVKVANKRIISDFPTNKEYGLNNSVTMKAKLTGADELYISQLNSLEKLDKETGKMIPFYTPTEVLLKLMETIITEWTFKNDETGEEYPITTENITSLYREDFDYLAVEFNKNLMEMLGVEQETDKLKETLTDAEKKESPTPSLEENDKSEPEVKDSNPLG